MGANQGIYFTKTNQAMLQGLANMPSSITANADAINGLAKALQPVGTLAKAVVELVQKPEQLKALISALHAKDE